MSRKRTDFRALQARRDAAITRPELRMAPKPQPLAADLVAVAIAAGRYSRIPAKKHRRRI